MNDAIEFYDSAIKGVARKAADILIQLQALVHRSEGRPRIDAGSAWSMPVLIEAINATPEHVPPAPTRIYDGVVETAKGTMQGLAPLPSDILGPVRLRLETNDGSLQLRAERLEIRAQGPGKYLEEFPGGSSDG